MNGAKQETHPLRWLAVLVILALVLQGGRAVWRRIRIPGELLSFAASYPEARDYVFSYPQEAGRTHEIDLSAEAGEGIPLLLQWDKRWGYEPYGDGWIGNSGCGPTCVSMVVIGLTGQTNWHPLAVAQFSEAQGYYENGVGTSWALMTEGAQMLGLGSVRGELTEDWVRENLTPETPLIASMSPGDFTRGGHFIVLTGFDPNGWVMVNDPNSPKNSDRSWELSRLLRQMKAVWQFRAQEQPGDM